MEQAKAPELRFRQEDGAEFPAWSKKSVKDIFAISNELNKETLFSQNDVLSASEEFGIVNQIDLQGRSFASEDVSRYKVVRENQIIYTRSPLREKPYGIVKIAKTKGIISPLYIVNNVRDENNPSFIAHFFEPAFRLNQYLAPKVRMGAKHTMNISNEEWLSGEIFVPGAREQQRIGEFLDTIDHVISNADARVSTLRTIKKGMLQKIFSQELRFKDDDGNEFPAWNTKCLDDIYSFQNGLNAGKEQFGRGIKLISVSEVLDNRPIQYNAIRSMVALDEKEAKRFSVKYGDILFQRSSETREDAGKCNVYLDTSNEAVFGGFVIRARAKIKCIPLFMNTLLKSNTVRKQVVRMAQGAQHVNVGQENLSAIQVSLPSLSEQQKIADYFTTLDNSIDATQRKTDTLRLIKKGLLQKMFV